MHPLHLSHHRRIQLQFAPDTKWPQPTRHAGRRRTAWLTMSPCSARLQIDTPTASGERRASPVGLFRRPALPLPYPTVAPEPSICKSPMPPRPSPSFLPACQHKGSRARNGPKTFRSKGKKYNCIRAKSTPNSPRALSPPESPQNHVYPARYSQSVQNAGDAHFLSDPRITLTVTPIPPFDPHFFAARDARERVLPLAMTLTYPKPFWN